MRRNKWGALALFLVLILAAGTALAGDVFKFEDKSITLFEGEKSDTGLVREGACTEEGELTYSSAGEKYVTVEQDGTVTGVSKGKTSVVARLKIGKKTWKATLSVTVLRAVTNVTLNTSKLDVYAPGDPVVSGLISGETEHQVILMAAGKSAGLKTTCTPSDASNKNVTYTSSDEGVLAISGNNMRALQAGECDLTIASVQNPEVKEYFHVVVTQPVKKITVSGDKNVFVGETGQLMASCEPATATIQAVTWSSRSPKVATVDENGVVTGLKRGSAVIDAKAVDGSGHQGSFTVVVAQKPTGVTLKETALDLVAGKYGQLQATVTPSEANDKTVTWTSSDPTIATVNAQGRVTALKRGECIITATSSANPEVSASARVSVVQRVTAISFDTTSASLNVRTSLQLGWNVLPGDATNPAVTFTSSNNKIATVDENGVVTGVSKGKVRIYAKAVDGSGVRGQISVQVIQPVEGVSIQYQLYHVQLDRTMNIKALIQPSNANNLAVDWTSDNPGIASITGRGKNVGTARGLSTGVCTITGTTQDGGYTATTTVWVNDFNRAIVVDDVYLHNDQLYMRFRNRGDFPVEKVYFVVDCYGIDPETNMEVPIVCNTDGVSSSFKGHYAGTLNPGEVTEDYDFVFTDYVQPYQPVSTVVVTIYSWLDTDGYTRNIPEEDQPEMTYRRYVNPSVYVTPAPETGDGVG